MERFFLHRDVQKVFKMAEGTSLFHSTIHADTKNLQAHFSLGFLGCTLTIAVTSGYFANSTLACAALLPALRSRLQPLTSVLKPSAEGIATSSIWRMASAFCLFLATSTLRRAGTLSSTLPRSLSAFGMVIFFSSLQLPSPMRRFQFSPAKRGCH